MSETSYIKLGDIHYTSHYIIKEYRPIISISREGNANGQIYNLWPYTNISLTVRVMNDKYVGRPSEQIEFTTKEGG